MAKRRRLIDLEVGEKSSIVEVLQNPVQLRLIELGMTESAPISMKRIAPLGDPIIVEIAGYQLCLRKQEASFVIVN